MSLSKANMVWNDQANAKLLVALMKVSEIKSDFEALAKELCTDETTCTPRAVQEQLKKLRKFAQGKAGTTTPGKSSTTNTTTTTTTTTTTPVKGPRTKATVVSAGVKKARKPAAGGKGKKRKSVDVDGAEHVPTKMEPESDSDNVSQLPSKKRKHEELSEGPGDVDGAKSADVAQDDSDELFSV